MDGPPGLRAPAALRWSRGHPAAAWFCTSSGTVSRCQIRFLTFLRILCLQRSSLISIFWRPLSKFPWLQFGLGAAEFWVSLRCILGILAETWQSKLNCSYVLPLLGALPNNGHYQNIWRCMVYRAQGLTFGFSVSRVWSLKEEPKFPCHFHVLVTLILHYLENVTPIVSGSITWCSCCRFVATSL